MFYSYSVPLYRMDWANKRIWFLYEPVIRGYLHFGTLVANCTRDRMSDGVKWQNDTSLRRFHILKHAGCKTVVTLYSGT